MLGESFKRSGKISYWLISKDDTGMPETLTVGAGGEWRALPVFSFPDEAEFFLRLGGFAEDGWRIIENTPGELFSTLVEGSSVEVVEFVALDPLPEMMSCISGAAISLVSLSRQRFMQRLAGQREYAFLS